LDPKKKADDVRKHLVHGRGFVVVHPAVIIPSEMNINEMTDLIGLAWENWYTRFRHGPMELKIAAKDHPICLGLPETIHFVDEAYWPLRGDKSKVTILATSDEDTGTDTQQKKPEPMFWTHQRGKGRIFGCILGHYTWTFDDPYLRILLLRGMAWAAREPVYRFDPLVLDGAPVK
jgi:type 1 glutamine amidotransferase